MNRSSLLAILLPGCFFFLALALNCSPAPLPTKCTNNEGCPPGLYCTPAGQCRQDCQAHNDCPPQQRCLSGQGRCLPSHSDAGKEPPLPDLPPEISHDASPLCLPGQKQSCYSGSSATRQQGTCREGVLRCLNGRWETSCQGEVLPTREICDGLDNDCDGHVDEECPCIHGQTQPCGEKKGICQQGQQICNKGSWSPCLGQISPQQESCDGLDNDCDGDVDEEDSRLGQTCSTNKPGECAKGTYVCLQGALFCTPLHSPTDEICDCLDNDCDGQTDEDCACQCGQTRACYTGPPSTQKVGRCHDGSQTCQQGKWSSCQGEQLPSAEDCNNKDDDCDGQTDEENPEGGKPCAVPGLKGPCRQGTTSCNSGALRCQQTTYPSPELCNNKDDDCDGTVDNNCSPPLLGSWVRSPSGPQKITFLPNNRFSMLLSTNTTLTGDYSLQRNTLRLKDDPSPSSCTKAYPHKPWGEYTLTFKNNILQFIPVQDACTSPRTAFLTGSTSQPYRWQIAP